MNSRILQLIRLILLFCGLIESAIILFYNLSSISNLALLPLSYAFSMLLMKNYYKNNIGLALIIIEVVKAFRYIVLPILILQEKIFEGVNIAPQYNQTAVLLMSYELIIVSIVLYFIAKKPKTFKILKKTHTNNVTFMWYFLIAIGLFVILKEPLLQLRLFNFKMSVLNELKLSFDSNEKISGFSRILFLLGIITTFAFSENFIYNLRISKTIKVFFQLILCAILVSSLWTNEYGSVTRWNMMIGIILSIYTLLFYYPKSRNKILIGGIGGVLFVLIIGSLLKTLSFGFDDYTISKSTQMYFSSQYFDEYFQGVRSVSNCILVAQKYANVNTFHGVLTDWFYSFPLFMKTVGLSNLPVATHYYHNVINQYDLIMPTITMGLLRFGWILAPLYSCVAVFFALHFDRKLKQERNILIKLFYIYIVFWFSLFMAVSPNVIDPNIWAPFIGIWLIKLESKIFYKRVSLSATKKVRNNVAPMTFRKYF